MDELSGEHCHCTAVYRLRVGPQYVDVFMLSLLYLFPSPFNIPFTIFLPSFLSSFLPSFLIISLNSLYLALVDPAAAAAAVPTDPTAYYTDYWLYASYYGEAAARLYYTQWSPPEGTLPPPGTVLPPIDVRYATLYLLPCKPFNAP